MTNPKPEPVAWMYEQDGCSPQFRTFFRLADDVIGSLGYTETPLYPARTILPLTEAAYTQGWNEAIEAAAIAYQAEAETWLQLPVRGSCSRLGAKAIRALSVPAIVEAGDGDV